ncbi:Fanconi anemia group D2 protein [Entophlyctis sp. JEL0112]|nr:Fanconi anemia group D2 protein [Entophlyctis sp. JEL0112]
MLAATPSQNQKGKAKTKSPPASRAEVFLDFLGACGLSVDTPHSPPRLDCAPLVFRRRIERKLRSSGHVPVTVKAFISGFKSFIDASALSNDDSDGADSFSEHLQYHARMSRATNLKFLLMNFRLNNEDHGNKHNISVGYSVVKILLSIPDLQSTVLDVLMGKLPEFMHLDSPDSSKLNENVPLLILHQLRFLDHVHDPKFLTAKLVELLEATNSDVTIHKEVIEFIPEVIPDSGVLQIVDALINCMSSNSKTAVAVLDTLGTIGVPDKELPRIIDTVLEMLKNAEIETLPIVIRFLLQTATPATVNELIPRIRDSIDLDAIAASLNLGGSDATLIFGKIPCKSVIEETHLPIDLIVLILLRQESQVQKKIDLVMRNKVKNSIFCPALIESTFDTFLNGLQGHFPTVIAICESLVREGAVYHKVASQMYVSAFPNFDTQSQQQLVGCLIAHIGSGVMYEVDCALAIMLKISESHPDDMLKFRIFVKGLVDYLDQLNVAQIRIVYEIFATLALSKPFETTDETESEITFESDLLNDMRIIIRKQLGSPDLKFKQMGVLGAVSLIKRLGAASETSDQESASSSSISSSRRADGDHGCVMALNFVTQIFKSCGNSCIQCVCLLLDELTLIMSASKMHPKFIVWISESFQSVFIDYFLLNAKNFDNFERCEVIPTVKNEIWFDIKDPDEVVAETVTSDVVEATVNDDMESNQVETANEISCVNVFPLSGWFYSSKKHRCAMDDDNEDPGDLYHEKQILMLLPSSFKFMQVVEFQTTHSLAELGQTLNMGLVMFDPAQIDDSPTCLTAEICCSSLFYAINYFREVLNAFCRHSVLSEENAFSKCGKVCLQRIMHILEMQRLFDRLVIVAPKWAPIGFFRDGEDGGDDFSDVRIPFVSVHSTEAVQNEAQESDDNDPMPTGETSATASRKSTKGLFIGVVEKYRPNKDKQLDVFNLLTCEYLKMGVSSDGDQDDICIKFPQMLFLFSELYFKLELTVSGVSNNKLKRKKEGLLGSGSVGSNSLGRVPKKDLMLLILKLGPSLCAGLELAYNEMRKGLEELEQSDTFIPKPKEYIENLWQIYDVVVKCFTLLFQWQDFKSDKYFKIFLKSLAARINPEPEVSPSQSIEAIHAKFVLDCHEYFIAFKHFCPSLSSAILLMKLLLALHECCSDENIANQMRLQMSELAKENLECQWQDEKPKNEAVLFLLQTQVENSPNPFEVVSEYIQSAFKGFIEQDAAVCEKYPMLNKSTFPIFFKATFIELVAIIDKLPVPVSKKPNMDYIAFVTQVAACFSSAVELSKQAKNFAIVLRYSRAFVQTFVKRIVPVLNKGLVTHRRAIVDAFKALQTGTRVLQVISNECKAQKDEALLVYIPPLRKALEAFIFEVKKIMVDNDLGQAFVLGNLKQRNLKGERVSSQISNSDDDDSLEDDIEESDGDQREQPNPIPSTVPKKKSAPPRKDSSAGKKRQKTDIPNPATAAVMQAIVPERASRAGTEESGVGSRAQTSDSSDEDQMDELQDDSRIGETADNVAETEVSGGEDDAEDDAEELRSDDEPAGMTKTLNIPTARSDEDNDSDSSESKSKPSDPVRFSQATTNSFHTHSRARDLNKFMTGIRPLGLSRKTSGLGLSQLGNKTISVPLEYPSNETIDEEESSERED